MDYNPDELRLSEHTVKEPRDKVKLPACWLDERPVRFVPPSAGDPWDHLKVSVAKYDVELCEGWNDDISSLLTFIGLFSAIVTAFIIESYTWLEEDPRSQSDRILAQILDHLTNSSVEGEETDGIGSKFVPERMAVRVNVLWFLSLCISLSAALVGILCKQWLREYQRDTSVPAKDAILLRQMRFQGLVAWHFPAIISSLPILVQISVFLFFAGMLELLWARHCVVATLASVVVGMIAVFALFTTIAPSFDILHLNSGDWREDVPAPCPYKSPQALFFYGTLAQPVRSIIAFSGVAHAKVRRLFRPMWQCFYVVRTRNTWPHSSSIHLIHNALRRVRFAPFWTRKQTPPDNQHHHWFKTEHRLLQQQKDAYLKLSLLWIRDNIAPSSNVAMRMNLLRCFISFRVSETMRILYDGDSAVPVTYLYYQLVKDCAEPKLCAELLIRTANNAWDTPVPAFSNPDRMVNVTAYALDRLKSLWSSLLVYDDVMLQVVSMLEEMMHQEEFKGEIIPAAVALMVTCSQTGSPDAHAALDIYIYGKFYARFTESTDDMRFFIAYTFSLHLMKLEPDGRWRICPPLRNLFWRLDKFLEYDTTLGNHILRGYVDGVLHECRWGAVGRSMAELVERDWKTTHIQLLMR